VNITKIAYILLALAMAASLSAFNMAAQDSAPTGYDLAAAVNAYRASMGYYQLNPNSLVASAAQTHAEWIVATGQGGHTGAGGSDETVRVGWTGYGGGAEIKCDENWASGHSIEDAVYGAWTDWVHQEVMLNAWGNRYTDIGGGVAAWGDGSYVFVLDVCLVVGQSASGAVPAGAGSTVPDAAATADMSNYVYGVTLATPQADGSVIHTVLYGQTLIAIAEAYGVTVEELREQNHMAADDSTIWTGEELLVLPPGSIVPTPEQPTAAPTSQADAPPSLTTASQAAPSVPASTQATITAAPTAAPQASDGNRLTRQALGILLIGVSAAGLVIMLYFSSRK